MLKADKLPIQGLMLIHPAVFEDERGYFYESYSEMKYKDHLLESNFVQDNFSKSKYGALRGLHYQVGEYAQGKLCQVIVGKVLDVAVDIRFGSPTFGEYYSVELSSQNKNQLWIPPGFAHGFSVLSEEAVFHYKCTNYYNKNSERCIIYDDEDLKINWGLKNPIISDKDKLGKKFKDIDKDFIYKVNT